MLNHVRTAVFVSLALAASVACAERQLYIPTARKLSTGTVKYELRYDTRDRSSEQYLGIGATSFWEVELYNREHRDATFDLTYNLISPITDLAPGLAFGFQDVLDETEGGRRPFAVATFRQGFYTIGGEQPADFTLGITYLHKRLSPLVGASIPFSDKVRLIAEHDGDGVAAGLEFQPVEPLTLKFIVRENRGLLGLSYRAHF
jgi:hypothetical protein